ncbi:MAG: MaoC family dehydratase [Deltaproteobacteria bacterium]|nr:MaoC family dehydratase [Deltaproteobacteria bacterium]
MTELKKNIGQETGLSDWFEITQERVDAFAEAIEDRQWIHCDVEKAKAGPFGGTIVHGPLLISLLGHLGGGVDSIPKGIKFFMHYGFDKVRFINPVPVGARIRNRSVLLDFIDKGQGRYLLKVQNTIEVEDFDKPACVTESLALIVT